VREHAVLQTLGFRGNLIARLIIGEGLVISALGGLVGCALAALILSRGGFALSVDALSIPIKSGLPVFLWSMLIACTLGILAGLVPAWQASRREIVTCFRAV